MEDVSTCLLLVPTPWENTLIQVKNFMKKGGRSTLKCGTAIPQHLTFISSRVWGDLGRTNYRPLQSVADPQHRGNPATLHVSSSCHSTTPRGWQVNLGETQVVVGSVPFPIEQLWAHKDLGLTLHFLLLLFLEVSNEELLDLISGETQLVLHQRSFFFLLSNFSVLQCLLIITD